MKELGLMRILGFLIGVVVFYVGIDLFFRNKISGTIVAISGFSFAFMCLYPPHTRKQKTEKNQTIIHNHYYNKNSTDDSKQ